jgi:uncharacterized protein YyaL (SSP411 family)
MTRRPAARPAPRRRSNPGPGSQQLIPVFLTPARQREIAGAALLAVGVLTLVSFVSNRGQLTQAWVIFLGRLAGDGRWLLPLLLGGVGAWLLIDSMDDQAELRLARPAGAVTLFIGLLGLWQILAQGLAAPDGGPLAAAALETVDAALDAMAGGGLLDQLGGGFHRYCVDADWTVPHFEKMLCDNALLLPLYLDQEARGAGRAPRRAAEATVGWLLREMRHPQGGFYAAQDADQEGGEGSTFVWRPGEFEALLGAEDGAWAAAQLGVTAAGSFEHGSSVLTRREAPLDESGEARLDRLVQRLLVARDRRPRPATDTKLLCGWNGLTISALVDAAGRWRRPDLLAAAGEAADFVLRELRLTDGGLAHVWRDGRPAVPAFLEDVAAMAQACLDLSAAGEGRWLSEGVALCDQLADGFADDDGAVCWRSDPRGERLFARQKDLADSAVPAGAALAARALAEARRLTGEPRWDAALRATLGAASADLERAPTACSGLLRAALEA